MLGLAARSDRRRSVPDRKDRRSRSAAGAPTDPLVFSCVLALNCIVNVIRALRMGSCLSSSDAEGSSRRGGGSSPSPPRLKRHRWAGSGRRRTAYRAVEWRREEQLHRLPGRMFLNGASSVASLFTQQGKKGANQDAMVVWENFGSSDTVFCGVFDGHGPYGHLVARRVRDSLPLKLSTHRKVNILTEDCRQSSISSRGSINSEEITFCMDDDIEVEEKNCDIFTDLKESFLKAFKVMDKELKLHPNIDCFCSGTTAVTLIKKGRDLVIGNVGDSRAVLGTRDENDCLVPVQLTVDLKPNLPKEAARIKKCKGRVFALHDEPEVARIWLPNNDSPGLAMARAFGDFCLKDFGLISVPEISYRRLIERDEFVVLATDGIWDVLSNQEVVDIVFFSSRRSLAARSLVEAAVKAWRLKYPTSKIDDCAVVCLFFHSDPSHGSSVHKENKQDGVQLAETGGSSKQEQSISSLLDHPCTAQATCENEIIAAGKEFSKPTVAALHQDEHPLGNVIVAEEEDWSALEGVSRVNTLVTLPRLVAGEKWPSNKQQK